MACPSAAYWAARFSATASTFTAQLNLQANLEGREQAARTNDLVGLQHSL